MKLSDSHNMDQFGEVIQKDVAGYIQRIPATERSQINPANIWFLTDQRGQHAVQIQIRQIGTWKQHLLIYDKNDKRIRLIIDPSVSQRQ